MPSSNYLLRSGVTVRADEGAVMYTDDKIAQVQAEWFSALSSSSASEGAVSDFGATRLPVYVGTGYAGAADANDGRSAATAVLTWDRALAVAWSLTQDGIIVASKGGGIDIFCLGLVQSLAGVNNAQSLPFSSTNGLTFISGDPFAQITGGLATPLRVLAGALGALVDAKAHITAAQIVSQTPDANSGNTTITVNVAGNLTAHAYQGKILVDAANNSVPILDNSTTTILVPWNSGSTALVAPLNIVNPAATIQRAAGGPSSFFYTPVTTIQIIYCGVAFNSQVNAWASGHPGNAPSFYGCTFLQSFACGKNTFVYQSSFEQVGGGTSDLLAEGAFYFNCAFNSVSSTVSHNQLHGETAFFQCWFTGCTNLSVPTFQAVQSGAISEGAGWVNFIFCDIDAAVGDALLFDGPQESFLNGCNIATAAGAAVHADHGAVVHLLNVLGVGNNSAATALSVVWADHGATIYDHGGNTVTGTNGDLAAGSLVGVNHTGPQPISWAGYALLQGSLVDRKPVITGTSQAINAQQTTNLAQFWPALPKLASLSARATIRGRGNAGGLVGKTMCFEVGASISTDLNGTPTLTGAAVVIWHVQDAAFNAGDSADIAVVAGVVTARGITAAVESVIWTSELEIRPVDPSSGASIRNY